MKEIKIGQRRIGPGHPVYVIAEIGSNFDGDLQRAKRLASLAREVGADAFKIQNFLAPKIVSATGFAGLQVSFQSAWAKPVVEIYKDAEFPRAWIKELFSHCRKIGIDFFSSPYDLEAVALLEQVGMPAYKIGSGEIDNHEFLTCIAKTKKPILLGCGAATMPEIRAAVKTLRKAGNDSILLLQCVTNYPSPVADAELKAMVSIGKSIGAVMGYSDHTIGREGKGDDPLDGLTIPLGAVALGAVVIEKHFTDDRTRKGPDHPFAMEPAQFKRMVKGIRAMERALGTGEKKVMPSEKQTVIIQRRGIYARTAIPKGATLRREHIEFLRPATGLRPPEIKLVLGKKAKVEIAAGQPITRKLFV